VSRVGGCQVHLVLGASSVRCGLALSHALKFCADVSHSTRNNHAASESRTDTRIKLADNLEAAATRLFRRYFPRFGGAATIKGKHQLMMYLLGKHGHRQLVGDRLFRYKPCRHNLHWPE